jgi:hypothetical protein
MCSNEVLNGRRGSRAGGPSTHSKGLRWPATKEALMAHELVVVVMGKRIHLRIDLTF